MTEAFAELRALPERDKRTLFASCVARTLKGQLAFEPKARPEVEATVARLDIDFAAAVRGNRDQVWTADLLWSRLRKDRILAIARGTLGETWAQAEAKQKKAEIAKAMQDAFAHGDGARRGHGRGPRRGHRLDAARLPRLRYRHRRRQARR